MFGGLGNIGSLLSLAMNMETRLKALMEELAQAELAVSVGEGDELSGMKYVKITANGLGENAQVSVSDDLCAAESKEELETLLEAAFEKMAKETRSLFIQKISMMAKDAGIPGLDGLLGGSK